MKILNSIITATALLVASACDDFGDTNVNPNRPTEVPVAGLLTTAINRLPDIEVDDINTTSINEDQYKDEGVFYAQYFSSKQYSDRSRYSDSQFDFTRMYASGLNALQEVIKLNSDEETMAFAAQSGSNANQIAVASILKAYYIMHATDRWGDLPVSEALQGLENITPVYDSQEKIYTDMFQLLKDAVDMMDSGASPKGDILYNGNMDSWEKFANTLRLRMALRLSNVDPTTASSEFTAAVADGVFESIADNAIYQFLGDGVFDNLWYNAFLTRVDFAVSNTLVDHLDSLSDPRLQVYADPNAIGEYKGMVYGMPQGEAAEVPVDSVSLPNALNVRSSDSPITILSYSQTLFALAEAVERDWIAGDAQAYYEAAIEASMREWGVYDAASFATFIAQDGVAWIEADAMRLISEQRWVALYLNGYEAWAEWRRTGYPDLQPPASTLNNSGQIPRRQGYPLSESLNNSINYEAAVARQGADVLDTRLWWDVD